MYIWKVVCYKNLFKPKGPRDKPAKKVKNVNLKRAGPAARPRRTNDLVIISEMAYHN